MATPACRAFTLVELLVVITIIVILLALFAPSLAKAIYEAELATCAARIRGHTAGVLSYAFDHVRHYPIRVAVFSAFPSPFILRARNNGFQPWLWNDDRPRLKPYVIADFHKDPLAPSDIDVYDGDYELSSVWSTYALWYGWRFTDAALGGKGSMRVGDPFEWDGEKFNVLVTDWDSRSPPQSYGSHPDRRNVLELWKMVNNDREGAPRFEGAGVAMGLRITATVWWKRFADAPAGRGYVDTNHGFQDNSVAVHRQVPFDVNPIYGYNGEGVQVVGGRPYDGPVTRVGNATNAGAGGYAAGGHFQVPRR